MRPLVILLQILAILAVLALLVGGLYFAFRFTADLYASYAPLLGTTAKAVIVTLALVGILLTLAVRRAAVQRRDAALVAERLRVYGDLVDAWVEVLGTDSPPGAELAAAERRMMLVANRAVIRTWLAWCALDPDDEDDVRQAPLLVGKVLREMRRELGADKVGFGPDEAELRALLTGSRHLAPVEAEAHPPGQRRRP